MVIVFKSDLLHALGVDDGDGDVMKVERYIRRSGDAQPNPLAYRCPMMKTSGLVGSDR